MTTLTCAAAGVIALTLMFATGCSANSKGNAAGMAGSATVTSAGSGGAAGSDGGAVSSGGAGTPGNGGAAGSAAQGGSAGAAGGVAEGGQASAGGSAAGFGGASVGEGGARTLIHPGALLTQGELTRMRMNVAMGSEPWASAWAAIENSDAGVNYQPTVTPTVSNSYALQNQGHAAYVLAVKWAASGDVSYANASKRILDAWVDTVTAMEVDTLRTGLGAVQMANAAEILAHGFDGGAAWPPAQVEKAKAWFVDVVWPRIGAANAQRSSAWGTSAMAGCMATAVFADDRAKVDYTIEAFKHGFTDAPDGCSGVTQYICNASGQATEAGRDQGHPQGGVGHLVEVALIAWNQGTDLVSYADARLVAGVEYLAQYNLGIEVPYDPNFADPCNVHPDWPTISPTGRGVFSPIYEMAHQLLARAGKDHPFTVQVLGSAGYRPEATNSDHVGLGTLSFR